MPSGFFLPEKVKITQDTVLDTYFSTLIGEFHLEKQPAAEFFNQLL